MRYEIPVDASCENSVTYVCCNDVFSLALTSCTPLVIQAVPKIGVGAYTENLAKPVGDYTRCVINRDMEVITSVPAIIYVITDCYFTVFHCTAVKR